MNVKQACIMGKWQSQTLSMSEEWILVCTHSCANSCKEDRVCDYEYWIEWAWLFEPAQTTTEGSGGYIVPNLMPGSVDISVCSRIATNKTPSLQRIEIIEKGGLKVVSAVQWETYCRRIDAADYKMIETRLNQNFRNVLPHDRSWWSRPNTTVSKRSNFRVLHF